MRTLTILFAWFLAALVAPWIAVLGIAWAVWSAAAMFL